MGLLVGGQRMRMIRVIVGWMLGRGKEVSGVAGVEGRTARRRSSHPQHLLRTPGCVLRRLILLLLLTVLLVTASCQRYVQKRLLAGRRWLKYAKIHIYILSFIILLHSID